MSEFTAADYWKSLVLYGINVATYKIALGKTLLTFSSEGLTRVDWSQLSQEFLRQYTRRLDIESPMPQQGTAGRLTTMERIVTKRKVGALDEDQAIATVGSDAFDDVIRRFHNLGRHHLPELQGMFYEFDFGKELILKDSLHVVQEQCSVEANDELDARWDLLEAAFTISNTNYQLANDLRQTYIQDGYSRTDITENIPFLQGYQGNSCFYCGEPILTNDIEVDHVLPRKELMNDEIWNLVLVHSLCNGQKSDQMVGEHFIQKLISRNENIMGSNHPWKANISAALGDTKAKRMRKTQEHYKRICAILNWNYWSGCSSYSPEKDPFYARLITVINNKNKT